MNTDTTTAPTAETGTDQNAVDFAAEIAQLESILGADADTQAAEGGDETDFADDDDEDAGLGSDDVTGDEIDC